MHKDLDSIPDAWPLNSTGDSGDLQLHKAYHPWPKHDAKWPNWPSLLKGGSLEHCLEIPPNNVKLAWRDSNSW